MVNDHLPFAQLPFSARTGVPDLGPRIRLRVTEKNLELKGLSCAGAQTCMFIVHSFSVGDKELTETIGTIHL